MGPFGPNMVGPHARSRTGTLRGIRLGGTPETFTLAPDQRQSQRWYIGRGTWLVHRHSFVAGKRTSRLLRRAGARTRRGDPIAIETTFDLEGRSVSRKAWLPGLKRVDLPVPGWAKRMARKLARTKLPDPHNLKTPASLR
jgi:hypothetical protein